MMPFVTETGSIPGIMRGILLAATWSCVIVFVTSSTATNQEPGRETHTASSNNPGKDSRGLFSPRMDYDEWTPLGRGDPLKNDPTYVYVPPVLERVHYWVDPSSRTPDPPAPGTMPLGQSSLERNTRPHEVPILRSTHKKPAPTITTSKTEPTAESRLASFVDPFLKFIDGPKFSSTPQQHYYHHNRPSSHNSQSQLSQYVMQSPYYQHIYHPKQRPNYEIQQSYSQEVVHNPPSFQQREPYTMLVPPPLQAAASFSAMQTEPSTAESTPTTTKTTVEIGKGNLVFHTSTSTVSDWVEGKTQLATLAAASNQVTWKIATPTSTAKPNNQSIMVANTNNKPSYEMQRLPTMSSTEAVTKMTTKATMKASTETYVQKNPDNLPSPLDDMGPLLASLLKDEWTTTMTTTPPNIITVTTVPSLTTDPLFSHYKQPAEPLRGPMYLIIQGHSKVKTYGASNSQSYHGIPLQETNDIQQGGEGDIDRSGRGVESEDDVYETENEERTEATCRDSDKGCAVNQEGKASKRKKRQLELDDLIPVEEAEYLLEEYLSGQSEGSGIGAILADAFTARRVKRTT